MPLPALLQNKESFDIANRMATALAHSDMVGPTLKGSVANCLTAMLLAAEMDESAVMVLQNIYFVKGRATWLSQYMVARASRAGVFRGPIRWRVTGDKIEDLSVTCYADLVNGGDEPRVDITLDYQTAVTSGWTTYTKDNRKTTHDRWATMAMATQMLRWRTAAWLVRLYAPHVMMGLPAVDELDDRDMIDVTPQQPKITELAEWSAGGSTPSPGDAGSPAPPAPFGGNESGGEAAEAGGPLPFSRDL